MKIAVLLPFARDRDGLADAPAGHVLHWLADERLDFARPRPDFDILGYIERCSDEIERQGIEAVLYSHEPANLVAAVLCERHGLPGPSLDAMLRTNHKWLSRQCEEQPIWHDLIELGSGAPDSGPLRYPCFLKPAYLWQSLYQFRLDGPGALGPALDVLRRELPPHCKPYRDFFAHYGRDPVLLRDVALVEQYLDHREQHCVMGWSGADGAPRRWGVYDRWFYPGDERAPDVSWSDSTLPPAAQEELFAYCAGLVRRHGIRGGFWNVDLCRAGGGWRTIEVNGRAATVWHELHRAGHGNSLYRAMLQLACGDEAACAAEAARGEENPAGRTAGQFHVVTFGEGPAGGLLDFAVARAAGVELLVDPKQHVRQTGSAGFVLGRFELAGSDRQALVEEADALRARLLRVPALSPAR